MGHYATEEQLISLVSDMASKINIAGGTEGVSGSYTPVGTIIAYMGTSAPADHLACDGSLHQIASYPQLADFFYENFGASNYFGGNGTSTFAVPDLRGEFLRGTGTNSHTGNGDGEDVGDHQDEGVPNITGYISDLANGNVSGAFTKESISSVHVGTGSGSSTFSTVRINASNSNSVYGNSQHITPTNTSILWCIKAIDYKVPEDRKQDYYSTEEIPVAKWIDGSTIFQCTYTFNEPVIAAATTWTTFNSISAVNIDTLISCNGISTGGSCWTFGGSCDSTYVGVYNYRNTNLAVTALTIQYIKTTI